MNFKAWGTEQAESIGSKLLLKALCKYTKQSPKTFILRGFDIATVNSQNQLKNVIRKQLQDDLVKDFDVGYYTKALQLSA